MYKKREFQLWSSRSSLDGVGRGEVPGGNARGGLDLYASVSMLCHPISKPWPEGCGDLQSLALYLA